MYEKPYVYNNVKMKIKFLTEYKKENRLYGGHIFAENWEEAEKLATQKGETVVGYIPPDCDDCESYGGKFNNQTS